MRQSYLRAPSFHPSGDNTDIEDWTIPRDQLEELEDAIGDAIVVRDSSNDQIGCCIIRRRRFDD